MIVFRFKKTKCFYWCSMIKYGKTTTLFILFFCLLLPTTIVVHIHHHHHRHIILFWFLLFYSYIVDIPNSNRMIVTSSYGQFCPLLLLCRRCGSCFLLLLSLLPKSCTSDNITMTLQLNH